MLFYELLLNNHHILEHNTTPKGGNFLSKKFKFHSKRKKEKINLSGSEKNISFRGVHIELFSNNEVIIEGCIGVMDYGNDYLKLNIGKGSVLLCGSNFDIVYFENSLLSVKGTISSLEFCI